MDAVVEPVPDTDAATPTSLAGGSPSRGSSFSPQAAQLQAHYEFNVDEQDNDFYVSAFYGGLLDIIRAVKFLFKRVFTRRALYAVVLLCAGYLAANPNTVEQSLLAATDTVFSRLSNAEASDKRR